MEITLYVQPGAKKTGLAGLHGGMMKLRVSAPAVEGAANEAVVKFVAEALQLPSSSVRLIRGNKSRTKTIAFDENLMKDRSRMKIFLNE